MPLADEEEITAENLRELWHIIEMFAAQNGYSYTDMGMLLSRMQSLLFVKTSKQIGVLMNEMQGGPFSQ